MTFSCLDLKTALESNGFQAPANQDPSAKLLRRFEGQRMTPTIHSDQLPLRPIPCKSKAFTFFRLVSFQLGGNNTNTKGSPNHPALNRTELQLNTFSTWAPEFRAGLENPSHLAWRIKVDPWFASPTIGSFVSTIDLPFSFV